MSNPNPTNGFDKDPSRAREAAQKSAETRRRNAWEQAQGIYNVSYNDYQLLQRIKKALQEECLTGNQLYLHLKTAPNSLKRKGITIDPNDVVGSLRKCFHHAIEREDGKRQYELSSPEWRWLYGLLSASLPNRPLGRLLADQEQWQSEQKRIAADNRKLEQLLDELFDDDEEFE